MKIAVTGASGKLGHHAVEELLKRVPAEQVVALARTTGRALDIAAQGVEVRAADYARPETLGPALEGVERLLLVSSSEVGQRAAQHQAVIEAARVAGVKLVAYTSILHADRSGLALAKEHLETEKMLRASGIPFVILRNGWYIENYTENLGPALAHGAIVGSADGGRIAAATRADFAAAAAVVITGEGHEGKVYELAGDRPFTMDELAAEVSKAVGRPIVYSDLPPTEYQKVLEGAGVPTPFAHVLVDSDLGIVRGELDDDSGDLRRLIGRPTTPLADAVRAAIR